ncbi:hypothetical protein ACTFIT_006447 [Dictyostelium discoideum]
MIKKDKQSINTRIGNRKSKNGRNVIITRSNEGCKGLLDYDNKGLESVHKDVPFLNKLNLEGHGENAFNAWDEVKDIWQELTIKYELFRSGVELRLAMAFVNSVATTHKINSFKFEKSTNEEKSQSINNNEKLSEALKRKI